MPRVKVRDGASLHVRELGQGDPVILLHGFGMQSLHWLPFALPLSLTNRVIIPDLRGFGRSHRVNHNQECIISNYVDDINDIADAFQLDRFKLAGISMGALTGLSYLHQNQDRVSHYLHIDQAPRCMNQPEWKWGLFGAENKLRIIKALELVKALKPYADERLPFEDVPAHLQQQLWFELGEFFASAMSKPFQKSLARKLCRYPSLAAKVLPTTNWPIYLHCLKAYIEQDYDLLPKLSDITRPVSVIIGMKSDMYPCGGQLRLADHLPNCEVIPFSNSGHAPLIDEPIRFMRELTRLANA